jgi:hypothetical protein
MLSIDAASNNTSVVFMLAWRGWRLLFTGDAEQRSWAAMDKQGQLKAVHFLKIAHHLSPTGTPAEELLAKIFPTAPPDPSMRSAAVSTARGVYPSVPDEVSRKRLSRHIETLRTVGELGQKPLYIKLGFPDLT